MSGEQKRLNATSSWRVARLLWKASRLRARGRTRHNQGLLNNKTGNTSNMTASWAVVLSVAFAAILHFVVGSFVVTPIDASRQMATERAGDIMVVLPRFADRLKLVAVAERQRDTATDEESRELAQQALNQAIADLASEASSSRRRMFGGESSDHEADLLKHLRERGSHGVIVADNSNSLHDPVDLPPAYWLNAMLLISFWFFALMFQGEGLDLDIQKRRHPHWEWLLSHPVKPVAAFSAEFMAPMLTNPLYLTAPVFWFTIFRSFWPAVIAVVLSLVAGIASAVAASCLNKSIEVAAMLRLPVQKRGYFLGLISIAGYVFLLLPVFILGEESIRTALLEFWFSVPEFLYLQFPAQLLLVGWSDTPNGIQVVTVFVSMVLILIFIALAITAWGTAKGIQATETQTLINVQQHNVKRRAWIKNPYYHKELLWLKRDKAAVLQVILIPMLLMGAQALNMQSVAKRALEQWNSLGALAILCGTYFLMIVGPRSLISEGNALWIAQTWPKSMESLLKAKARLWFSLSTIVVFAILLITLAMFPEQAWKIILLGIGWLFFGWALAMKSVCLVTVPTSSGEVVKPAPGRKWLAFFGTMAFAGGVMVQSWHVATMGVMFTVISAAAMWQNLRARLPYLFDPWSERRPKAPTLIQSMVGIAIMAEVLGLALAIATGLNDPENLWLTRTFVYAVVGGIAWGLMSDHLSHNGVGAKQIWYWDMPGKTLAFSTCLLIAVILGVLLAGVAYAYLDLLRSLSATSEYMAILDELGTKYAHFIAWQVILVAGLVPFVEEYFFRGLLFRSLDREVGGWKAIIGSSAFFAVYHPPVSWLPVFLLGVSCAWVFKRGGRLLPCVVIHMLYNFLILTVVN